ncbi:MAG: hypothetical protein QMD05_11150 [Candidatus Brocadiaceae bacterium]|nr:hypothetical protein [Candidatus Brocadiaceae bacterium]
MKYTLSLLSVIILCSNLADAKSTVYYQAEYNSGPGGGNPELLNVNFLNPPSPEIQKSILYSELEMVAKFFNPKKQVMGSTFNIEGMKLSLPEKINCLIYDPKYKEIRPMKNYKDPFEK